MQVIYSDTSDGITVKAYRCGEYALVDVTVPLPDGGTRTTGFLVELKKAHPKEHA